MIKFLPKPCLPVIPCQSSFWPGLLSCYALPTVIPCPTYLSPLVHLPSGPVYCHPKPHIPVTPSPSAFWPHLLSSQATPTSHPFSICLLAPPTVIISHTYLSPLVHPPSIPAYCHSKPHLPVTPCPSAFWPHLLSSQATPTCHPLSICLLAPPPGIPPVPLAVWVSAWPVSSEGELCYDFYCGSAMIRTTSCDLQCLDCFTDMSKS